MQRWNPPEPPPCPPNLSLSIALLSLVGIVIGYTFDDKLGQWVIIAVQTALCVETLINYRRYRKIMKRDMERLELEVEQIKREIKEAIEAKMKEMNSHDV